MTDQKEDCETAKFEFLLNICLIIPSKGRQPQGAWWINRVLPEWLIWHKHTALGVISQVATT